MERTNSQVSCRYDELIAKQAAKTKEQAATAKELTLEHEGSAGRTVYFCSGTGQHPSPDPHSQLVA